MKKQDLIDALKAKNVQDEELQGFTMAQMAQMLSEIRKREEEEAKPKKPKHLQTIEITRSYSRKVNLGNYESEDFFCSRKAEVRNGDDLRKVSKWLAYECKVDVEMEMDTKEVPF